MLANHQISYEHNLVLNAKQVHLLQSKGLWPLPRKVDIAWLMATLSNGHVAPIPRTMTHPIRRG